MATTSLEMGIESGLQQGFQQGFQQGVSQGRREIIELQIEHRFGKLSNAAKIRLDALDDEQLRQLARKLLSAKSLEELGLTADAKE